MMAGLHDLLQASALQCQMLGRFWRCLPLRCTQHSRVLGLEGCSKLTN